MAKPVILRFVGDTKRLSASFLRAGSEAQTFGGKIRKMSLGISLGVGAAVGTAAAGLAKLGGDFHSAYASIAVTTGATGKQLEGLRDSFKNVLGQTPANMTDVAGAISTINQKLGLTGKPLEDFSLQMIRLGRITKTDIAPNIKAVTGVLNNWSIPASKAGETTELLFRAFQKSGVPVAELSAQLAQSGPQFRALGMSVSDATGLLGVLGKAGMNVGDVLPAMSKSLAKAAKDGKPAAQVFRDTFASIKNAPNDVAAAKTAVDVFGSRAGPKFAQLIREGKLEYESFTRSIVDGKSTIQDTAKATSTWQGKLGTLRNQVKVALEPLATKVFGAMTDAVSKMMPYLGKFQEWFKKNKETLKPYAIALGILTAAFTAVSLAVGAFNAVLAINPITLMIVAIAALVVGIIYAYQHFEGFRNVIDAVGRWFRDKLWPAMKQVGDWIYKNFPKWKDAAINAFRTIWQYIQPIWNGIWNFIKAAVEGIKATIHIVMSAISGDWSGVWDGIKDYFSAVWDMIGGIFDAGVGYLRAVWDGFTAIGSVAWDWLSDGLVGVWNWILRTIGSGVNMAIDILNDLIDAANYIPGVDIDHIGHVTWGQTGGSQKPTATTARGGNVRAMATGGIVTRPTLALVGEAGPEAVIPLGSLRGRASTFHITVNALDPKSAAVAVVDALKIYERNRGPIPVKTRIA